MVKCEIDEQTSFLDAIDVEQLMLDGPIIGEESMTSRHSSEHLMDLEVISDEMEMSLLPEFNTNSLEDISSFAEILSPMDGKEIPDEFMSVYSFDSTSSRTMSEESSNSSVESTSSMFDHPSMLSGPPVTTNGLTTFVRQSKLSISSDEATDSTRPNTSSSSTSGSTKKGKKVRDKKLMKKKGSKSSPKKSSAPSFSSSAMTSAKSFAMETAMMNPTEKNSKFGYSHKTGSVSDTWNYSTGSSKSSGGGSNTTRTGRWTAEEHQLFLQGIAQHGRHWEKVAKGVKSRTTVQVRSHAQKYFKKLAHRERFDSNGSYSSREGKMLSSCELTDAIIMKNAAYELNGMTSSSSS